MIPQISGGGLKYARESDGATLGTTLPLQTTKGISNTMAAHRRSSSASTGSRALGSDAYTHSDSGSVGGDLGAGPGIRGHSMQSMSRSRSLGSSSSDLGVRSRTAAKREPPPHPEAPARATPPDKGDSGNGKSFYEMARDALNDARYADAYMYHASEAEAESEDDGEGGSLDQRAGADAAAAAAAAAWAASMSKGALHAVGCVRRVEEIRRLTVEHSIGRDGGFRCRVEIDLVHDGNQERNA